MNSEREKADILFDYGLPLQFCCHLIQFYTLLFLRVATLRMLMHVSKKLQKLESYFYPKKKKKKKKNPLPFH